MIIIICWVTPHRHEQYCDYYQDEATMIQLIQSHLYHIEKIEM